MKKDIYYLAQYCDCTFMDYPEFASVISELEKKDKFTLLAILKEFETQNFFWPNTTKEIMDNLFKNLKIPHQDRN